MDEQALRVPAGGVVFEEGSVGSHMFVIASGRLRVSKVRDGMEVVLNEMGPGAFFGELGLLESLPRSATVTAVEESVLHVIDSAALMRRLASDPLFGLKVLQRVAAMARRLSEQVLDAATASSDEAPLAEAEYTSPGYL